MFDLLECEESHHICERVFTLQQQDNKTGCTSPDHIKVWIRCAYSISDYSSASLHSIMNSVQVASLLLYGLTWLSVYQIAYGEGTVLYQGLTESCPQH